MVVEGQKKERPLKAAISFVTNGRWDECLEKLVLKVVIYVHFTFMPFITSSGCPGPTKCTLRAAPGREMADFKLGDILKTMLICLYSVKANVYFFFVFLFMYCCCCSSFPQDGATHSKCSKGCQDTTIFPKLCLHLATRVSQAQT